MEIILETQQVQTVLCYTYTQTNDSEPKEFRYKRLPDKIYLRQVKVVLIHSDISDNICVTELSSIQIYLTPCKMSH